MTVSIIRKWLSSFDKTIATYWTIPSWCDFFLKMLRVNNTQDSDPKRAYLDISMGGVPQGRILLELFHEHCPKTAANFLALCRGDMVP